jgi:2,4'-dihydroxyacetophenone dioxygenase
MITAFSDTNDGLRPEQRQRGHFIANVERDNARKWVPYAEGVWIQPCCFDLTAGGFAILLKGLPGAQLGVHYHAATVRGYTLRGHWRYLEHDWIAKPGTFIYEPAGEAHTLVVTDDSPEPAEVYFDVKGAVIFLDRPKQGAMAAYEDGFSLLALCRKYYREADLDVRELDELIR